MRARRWCLTVNSQVQETKEIWKQLKPGTNQLRYLVFQEETVNRVHLQAYVEFTAPLRLQAVKTALDCNSAHAEPAKGNPAQNVEYCTKEDSRTDGPWEIGEASTLRQGQRNDLIALRDAIKDSTPLRALYFDHFGAMARASRSALCYRQLLEAAKPRDTPPVVKVYWGVTGSGKTRRAYDEARLIGDPYFAPVPERAGGTAWFDGYDGVGPLIIDEFAGEYGVNFTKRLLDRYPVQLPVKGGFISLQACNIWITSNKDPEEWFPEASPEDRSALRRRYSQVVHFSGQLGRTASPPPPYPTPTPNPIPLPPGFPQ